MDSASSDPPGGRERLLDAAEHLFARDGIHGARLRDINELAGQKNSSALHYHFGNREALATEILLRHQHQIDKLVEARLDELERLEQVTVRSIIDAIVVPTAAVLTSQSGRDWARIIPQILGTLSANLRRGVIEPATAQSHRIFKLLEAEIAHLPEPVRRERLVSYAILLTSLLAERAHHLESGFEPALDDRDFATYMTDVLVAVVTAPTSV